MTSFAPDSLPDLPPLNVDFQALFQGSPDLYLVLTVDLRIAAVSDAYLRATMTRREDILGKPLFEIFPNNPEEISATGVQCLSESLGRVLAHKKPDVMGVTKYDIRRPSDSGAEFEERFWKPTNTPVLDNNQQIAWIIHRVEDITEFVHLQKRQLVQEQLLRRLQAQTTQLEGEIDQKQLQFDQVLDKLATPNRGGSILLDRAEDLRASEERFRSLVESIHDYAIFMLDPLGNVISWNQGAERLKGYREEEIFGRHFSIFYPAEGLSQGVPETGLRMAIAQGRFEDEGIRVRKDGSEFWANVIITPIYDSRGDLQGFSKITRDLTERLKNEEQALKLAMEEQARKAAEERTREIWEQREELRVTLQCIGDGVIVTDSDGRVRTLNAIAESLTGWPIGEAEGELLTNIFQIVSEVNRETVSNPALRALREGCIVGLANHTLLISRDGSERPIADSAAPIRNSKGNIFGVVLVFRDVTESKRLEEQYRQAQKMEAVGRLAGGVAHDFNNLLTVILSYGNILSEDASLSFRQREMVQEICRAGERAATVTHQLLAFSRQQLFQLRVLNLNEVVSVTSKMLERLIGEDIILSTSLSPDLLTVQVDRSQIEQALVNLAVNARDAMLEGGHLRIETANVELTQEDAHEHLDVVPGKYVLLTVSDDGCGMDSETKSRIFEPFFTTKEPGKGTGLGLSMVFGVIKQSSGHMTVSSEPGQGTTFKIYLPVVEIDAVEEPLESARPPLSGGSETILIVEDEEMVRHLASQILLDQGYTVLQASCGSEAVEICRTTTRPIHLVLTDVIMPEMSGRQISECILKSEPHLKFLFMSGYTDDSIVRQGILQSGAAFLQKPFTPASLIHKIRELLDES